MSGGKGRERDSAGERKVTERRKGAMEVVGKNAWLEQEESWCRMEQR